MNLHYLHKFFHPYQFPGLNFGLKFSNLIFHFMQAVKYFSRYNNCSPFSSHFSIKHPLGITLNRSALSRSGNSWLHALSYRQIRFPRTHVLCDVPMYENCNTIGDILLRIFFIVSVNVFFFDNGHRIFSPNSICLRSKTRQDSAVDL